MHEGEIRITVQADTSDAERGMNRLGKALAGLERNMYQGRAHRLAQLVKALERNGVAHGTARTLRERYGVTEEDLATPPLQNKLPE